ncbi:dihydrofolate reductase family protein [Pseudochryseolinea flava]|uniref:Dihydrofolate reductase n=1 Tax=Pseudochryseolinea flava TaxID=2059302 RepID=A0A364Y113_9BACT|nr:dihydrofolate reductase family protein [Pseudochryseolinea flava]RAW00389.1 dihydrofolate reductase [Pseudochryseolinea flava]
MRKIIVISMISLDGIIQSPGSPEEDTSGDFKHGGWVAPFSDGEGNKLFSKLMAPADVLLGRKTFDIWENYWPQHENIWPGINDVTKFVVSKTKKKSSWKNTMFLQTIGDIKKLRHAKGADIQVWGSSELIQALLEHDLVDQLWLILYPITLGHGKKLFTSGSIPASFRLHESIVTTTGVIAAHYIRAGQVKTGTAGK